MTFIPGLTTFPKHSWHPGMSLEDACGVTASGWEHFHANKAACNVSRPPMPYIGLMDSNLWDEFCGVKIDLSPYVPTMSEKSIQRFLEGLKRPILLLHTKGDSVPENKNIGDSATSELYFRLLEWFEEGTIVLLDWSARVPRVFHSRVRHLGDDFELIDLAQTYALIRAADLLIGIDSGPAHFARFTETPTLVVWARHFPSRFMLPSKNVLHLVPKRQFNKWTIKFRHLYNIIESGDGEVLVDDIAEAAYRMVQPNRYLPPGEVAADVKLQHHIDRLTAGGQCEDGRFNDRNRGFDIIARCLCGKVDGFQYVETGSIRSREDWAGAGYSTYLFGELAFRTGGCVTSIEKEPVNCIFAKIHTHPFAKCVNIVCANSVEYLKGAFARKFDVLYLDSLDRGSPGCAEHALEEVISGMVHVASRGLIAFDDTNWERGRFAGKGALAVPMLIEKGWGMVHSGYQTILRKP